MHFDTTQNLPIGKALSSGTIMFLALDSEDGQAADIFAHAHSVVC